MPLLVLLKSPTNWPSSIPLTLDGETSVIGRDTTCQILIPHHAVSRKHAQITRQEGRYFIEDLKSRNKTFVNGTELAPSGRRLLKPDDRIKICDFLFRFHDERAVRAPQIPEWMSRDSGEEEEVKESTTIEATQGNVRGGDFLEFAPSDQLRALLDISAELSRVLEVDPLGSRIADALLTLFKQADRCFVLLLDSDGRPVPRATKNRRGSSEDVRFSRTIVRKTIESMQAYLTEDSSGGLPPSASIAEFKIRSVMCVPLALADGRPLGAILLDTQTRSKKFTPNDLNVLAVFANIAGMCVDNVLASANLLARECERRESEFARALQFGCLPRMLPEVDGYEFYAHYVPAQLVTGDYYDFVPLRDERILIIIGDVTGRGAGAAIRSAKLCSEARHCFLTCVNPAQAMSLLNESLHGSANSDQFVSLVLVVIDLRRHEVTLVNAGHTSPKWYQSATGEVLDAIAPEATGLPLGVVSGYQFEQVTFVLEVGDAVVLFTDGVTAASDPLAVPFGQEGVTRHLPPDETSPDVCRPGHFGERLATAVRAHTNGRAQDDDRVVVAFGRITPPAESPENATKEVPVLPVC